jgi:riboflavin synthase alpha subunit
MFTGLIEDVGVIEEARDSVAGRELRVRSAFT